MAGEKALLTGISRGRAGNLRGMDHLTGILHYVRTVVHPNKLPISIVDTLFDQQGMGHEETLRMINNQLDEFIEFLILFMRNASFTWLIALVMILLDLYVFQ